LEELQRGCEWPVSGYLLKSEVENTGMPWNWGVGRLITVSTSCSCTHCLPAAAFCNNYEVIFHTWQRLSFKAFPSEFSIRYIDPFVSSASLKPHSPPLSFFLFLHISPSSITTLPYHTVCTPTRFIHSFSDSSAG
jgi:hypothetical protein